MTVYDIFYDETLVNDSTVVRIQKGTNNLATGNWFNDNILAFEDRQVLSLLWSNDTLTIKIK